MGAKTVQISLIVVLFFIIILIVIAGIPSIGSYQLLLVQSGSMEPAIKAGSLVVVNPSLEYKKGDIITFAFGEGQMPTTHRIYDKKSVDGELVYTTKGDANNAPDQRNVFEDNIIGKVFFSVPYAGYLVNFVKKPIGFALLLFIPASIIIFDQGKNIFREIKKKKNKNE